MPKKKREKKVSEEDAKLLEELKRLMREGRRAYAKRDLKEAKKFFSKGQELAHEKGWKRDADVFKASILIVEKKLEEVIALLVPIVEMPDLHLRGHAYDRLGYAQDELKFYDECIVSYQKALDDPGYDTPGYAWHNMGAAYYNKGEYDKAIECYQKALDTPGYDKQGYTWHGMGLVYRDKGELYEALKWLKKARDWYKENEPEEVGRVDSIIRSIKREMQLRKSGLDEAAEEFGEIARLSPKEPEDPLGRIKVILDENRNRVEEHAKRDGTAYKDILAILKGWSSSIPIVSAVERERFSGQICLGGGYFVKARKEGIIIDPGLDFLTNFASMGFHIKEVSQVVVSHNHIDHCADLIRLVDLEHQWRLYDPKAKRKPNICFHLDIDTHEGHRQRLLDMGVDNLNVRPINSQQPNYSINEQVTFKVFHTQHDPDNKIPDSIGFVVNLKVARGRKRSIGYTSDTAFFKSLPKYLSNCDIIIAHFSYAEPADYEGKESHTRHLGYTGLLRLIRETEANLYIISEFWGGRGDYRIELAQKLRYDFKREGREVKIIPGDVGCLIGLRELDIRCSRCGMWVPYEEIFVTAPDVPFGKLRYLCKNCLLGNLTP